MIPSARLVPFFVAMVFTAAVPAYGEDNAAANKLFVEAVLLVRKADAAESPWKRVRLYKRALKNLDEIVARHPGSNLAVKLITGQHIGSFARSRIEKELKLAQIQAKKEKERCFSGPTPQCLFDQALGIARIIEDAISRASALKNIAEEQARAGDIAGSLETAGSIEDRTSRTEALVRVAEVHAENGDFNGAKQASARALESARFIGKAGRVETLTAIAEVQFKSRDFDGVKQTIVQALKIARRESAIPQVPFLNTIAIAQARSGDIPGAEQTLALARKSADTILSTEHRSTALIDIAQAEGEVANIAEAGAKRKDTPEGTKQTIARKLEKDTPGRTKQTIARELESAKTIESLPIRVSVLAAIAEAQAKSGDFNEAKQTLIQALGAARKIEYADDRARAFADIAAVLALSVEERKKLLRKLR